MRKLFIFCLMSMVLSSCSERMPYGIDNEAMNDAKKMDSIVFVANDFATYFYESSLSRSCDDKVVKRTASGNTSVIKYSFDASRSNNSNLFIVNYDADNGFAVVASDKNGYRVIAFIEEGQYDTALEEKIEGFSNFMACASYNDWQANDSLVVIANPAYELATPPYHLIGSKWGQEGIYGAACPNGISGCFPTAIAQIMAYHQQPKVIEEPFAWDNEVELDWWTMRAHSAEKSNLFIFWGRPLNGIFNPDRDLWPECRNTSCTKQSHDQLAKLMYDIGRCIRVDYLLDGTGLAAGRILMLLINIPEHYGYGSPSRIVGFNERILKRQIQKKQPVLMFGGTPVNDDGVSYGHAWVCDGEMEKEDNGVLNQYFYYNWGYDGAYNGYYLSGVFKLNKYVEYNYNVRMLPYQYPNNLDFGF